MPLSLISCIRCSSSVIDPPLAEAMPEEPLSSTSSKPARRRPHRRRPRCRVCLRPKRNHPREGCPFGPPGSKQNLEEGSNEEDDDDDYDDEDGDEDEDEEGPLPPPPRAQSAPVRLRSTPVRPPTLSSTTTSGASQARHRRVTVRSASNATRRGQDTRLRPVQEEAEDERDERRDNIPQVRSPL